MSAQWLPWLADQPDDLRRVSRMVDLLIVADRATSETVPHAHGARPRCRPFLPKIVDSGAIGQAFRLISAPGPGGTRILARTPENGPCSRGLTSPSPTG